MDLDREPKKVDIVAAAADGGTLAVDVFVDDGVLNLFVDNRIGTSTPNQVYTSYPGESGSRMLDSDSRLVLGIKKLIEPEDN